MGSITARPVYDYGTDSNLDGVENFLAGTGEMYTNGRSITDNVQFYGLNFEDLRGKNFTATGFTLSVTGGRYGTSYATNTKLNIGFRSGPNSYATYIGTGSKTIYSGDIANTTVTTVDQSTFPDVIPWINANKEAFLNGVNEYTFGLYCALLYTRISDITFTLHYELEKSKITVVAGTGGTVTGGGEYESGSTATLTATPNTGYKFKQWSDGNTSNPRTITVTGNATYTAEFEKIATSNTFRGTSRQTAFGGTVKQTVYKGTTKIS